MLDLKKAFDSIVHKILLDKLYFIGMLGASHIYRLELNMYT